MTTWTPAELALVDRTHELDITTTRPDGTRRPATPIWVVRVGEQVYVRSYRGAAGAWFRHALTDGLAQVRLGSLERNVQVRLDGAAPAARIDAAYRSKYGENTYTNAMLAPDAVASTLRLDPTSTAA